jgi:adhesin transport system outer membrane protein
MIMLLLHNPLNFGRLSNLAVGVVRTPPKLRGLLTFISCFVAGFIIYSAAYAQGQIGLGDLISETFATHPALRGQQGMQEAAQAGVAGAHWQFYPTPSLSVEQASTATNDPSYRGDQRVITAGVRQPLWTGGRLTGNLAKAEAQDLAARAELEGTRQQLALRVIQAYAEALAAQKKHKAWEESRATHQRLLDMVIHREREGASAASDVLLARSRLNGVDADRMLAQAQYAIALERLRLLIGGRHIAVDALQAELPPMDSVAKVDRWLDSARALSPQISKARAQVRVSEAETEAARAALSPEVSLRAERQWGNFGTSGSDPQNRIFLAVSTAFGGGLSSLSGVDAARARSRAAVEDVQTQQMVVDDQVQSDLTLWQISRHRRESLQEALAASTTITASWERQFLAGRKNWQDLINAAREQAQIEAQISDVLNTELLTGWRLFTLAHGVDALLAPPKPLPTLRKTTAAP